MDGYATHQQALVKAALESEGNILETGCGFYSTPILYEICKARGTKLVSMVQDLKWADNFKHLIGNNYEQIVVDFNEPLPIEGDYGMVFLDHEQVVKERILHINNILNHTPIMVAHDSNHIRRWNFLEHRVTMEHFKDQVPNTVILRK